MWLAHGSLLTQIKQCCPRAPRGLTGEGGQSFARAARASSSCSFVLLAVSTGLSRNCCQGPSGGGWVVPERGLRSLASASSIQHPGGAMATGPAAMVAGGAETLVQGLDVALGQAVQSRGLGWKCWGEVWGLGWGWRGRTELSPAGSCPQALQEGPECCS